MGFLATLAATLCAALSVTSGSLRPASTGTASPHALLATPTTARMLLQSPELADVAAEQLQSASGHLLADDISMVRAIAAAGFGNISAKLKSMNPEVASQLDSFQLTSEQHLAVVDLLKQMSNSHLMKVGEELARSLQQFLSSAPNFSKVESVKLHLSNTLTPRLPELRRLRDEVIPTPLRRLRRVSGVGEAVVDSMGLTIDAEHMRLVSSFDNSDWNVEFGMTRPERNEGKRHLDQADGPTAFLLDDFSLQNLKHLGVAGGVVQQAHVILDQLKNLMAGYGIDVQVPSWVSSLDGQPKPFVFDLLSCTLDSGGSLDQMITCPMRFASAGIDILSSLSDDSEEK